MSRHLFAVGHVDRLGAGFLPEARRSAAFASVTSVKSMADLNKALRQSDDEAVVLVCDESARQLMSLADTVPVVVCTSNGENGDDALGHPFIHWIPHADDEQASVRSLVSLVDQVWSARQGQIALHEEAERAHRFFAVLANASMEAVLVFREGRVVHANDLACRILGIDRSDLVGFRPVEMVHPAWRSQVLERMNSDQNVYSFLFQRKDGSTVPLRVHGQNIDIEGVTYRITSFTDLSREGPVPYADDWSERELYGAEAPVVWIDSDGNILYMNTVMREMLLIGADPVEGRKIWEFDEELDEHTWPDLMNDFRDRGAVTFRTHLRRGDDSTFHILVQARHRRLDDFEYISASFEDVSEQVEMRRSITHSRQRLELALEAATIGLWEWNVETGIISVSPELEEMFAGYGEIPSSGVRALLQGVDRRDVPAMIETLSSAVNSASRFSVRCRLARMESDEQTRWLECWGDVVEDENTGETIVLGAALDITDRRRRLREIQLERERFRAFADGSLDGFFLLEARLTDDGVLDFVPTYVNNMVSTITGMEATGIIGDSMRDNCPVSIRVGIIDTIAQAYTSGETREGEFEIRRKSGAVIWARVQAVPYSRGVGVVVRDITDRRRREAELAAYRQRLEDMVKARTAKLRRSEAEFRSVVESARDIMGIVDDNHVYQFINHAARSSRSEILVGRRAGRYIRESHRESFHTTIDEVFNSGEEGRLAVPVDWEDRSIRWMDCRFSPVLSDRGTVEAVTIVCRDVTEQREINERIEELNRGLEQRVVERTSEIRALLNTSRKLAALQDESTVLGTVTDALASLVPGATGVSVWGRESDSPDFGLLAYDGVEASGHVTDSVASHSGAKGAADDRIPRENRLIQKIRENDGALLLTTEGVGAEDMRRLSRVRGCRNALATSLADARGVELVVFVALRKSVTSADDRTSRLLESVTAQAAVAIHNARLFREIRAISVRLLHVQENERREIAHELHDQVGGLLTSLQFVLQLTAPTGDGSPSESVMEAQNIVKSLMDEVRSLTLTLRPALLDDFGLAPALEGLIKRHRKQGALDVDFEYDFDRGKRFDADVETTAYRVIQEALTNVIRHAKTDTAAVQLSLTDDELRVEIEDRGRGFEIEHALKRGRSLGVRGMFERVELLEGRTQIDSVPGEGTRIQFRIPLLPNGTPVK